MFHLSTDNGVVGGPLLPVLSIPARDAPMMMSPAEAIASGIISPSDTYVSSGFSSASSHSGPFTPATPADALHMDPLAQHPHPQHEGDVPNDVEDQDTSEIPMSYGFWPAGDTFWADMGELLPEDFNLSSIPPVELGIEQFQAYSGGAAPPPQLQCDEGPAGGLCPDWMPRYDPGEFHAGEGHEEHDFDDVSAATPGGPDSSSFSVYAHEHMNW